MVTIAFPAQEDPKPSVHVLQVGGCCVCSDEQGWNENPLVYCDGKGCTVAVHQGTLAHTPHLTLA